MSSLAAIRSMMSCIPARNGEQRNSAVASDFLVVGSYPPAQGGDILHEARTVTQVAIAKLARPPADPVSRKDGPLLEYWRPLRSDKQMGMP